MTRRIFGVIVPVAYVTLVLVADYVEGPRISFAGTAIAAPFITSIFAGPILTSFVSLYLLAGVIVVGLTSDQSGVVSQPFRILLLGVGCFLAIAYAWYRVRRERRILALLKEKVELEVKSQLGLNDELTGLMNRRGLFAALETEDRWPRTVAVFDLDGLKEVNDRFGHGHGDAYITAVAQRLRGGLAASDLVCRWGGDEFLVILPLAPHAAQSVLTRVIDTVMEQPIVSGPHRIKPHLSAGAAQWKPSESLDAASLVADGLMYEAKYLGGNQLRIVTE